MPEVAYLFLILMVLLHNLNKTVVIAPFVHKRAPEDSLSLCLRL